jgi:hypothetical protein
MYKPTGRPRGRPVIYDEPATERMWLRVTPAAYLELKLVARENGLSLAGLLRDAVNVYVGDYAERHPFPPRRADSRSRS